MPRSIPQRSCIGCRCVKDKKDLIRFVAAPDRTLVPDLLERLPGRGAYTCRTRECLRSAADRKQFARAFKGEIDNPDSNTLIAGVIDRVEERLSSYIALANKAGRVVSGGDMVMEALQKQKAGIVFLAGDISRDIGEKITRIAERAGIESIRMLTKEQLGSLLGKELRSAVAIEKGGFAETIKQELEKYRNFLGEGRTQHE